MIADDDKAAIRQAAARYGAARVLLFGSGADPARVPRDLDLAVEGLPAERFFDFYGELLFSVSKPVDLVDLSQDTRFTRLVRAEGIPLYDVTARAGSG
jgi:predicted nucleotidyltransferase